MQILACTYCTPSLLHSFLSAHPKLFAVFSSPTLRKVHISKEGGEMDLFVKAETERLTSTERSKRRQLRIAQVRQQTSDWMNKPREEYKAERDRQIKILSDSVIADAQSLAVDYITYRSEAHTLAMNEIGTAHEAAAAVRKSDSRSAQAAKEIINDARAKIRYGAAIKEKKTTAMSLNLQAEEPILRRKQVRFEEDIKAKELVEKLPFGVRNGDPNKQKEVGRKKSEYQQGLVNLLHIPSKPCEKENFVAVRKKKTQPRKVLPPPKPKEGVFSKLADVRQAEAGTPDLARMISSGESPAFKRQKLVPDVTFYDASLPQPPQKYRPPIGLVERVAKQEATAWTGAKNATREMLETKLRKSLDAIEKQKKTEERGKTALKIAKLEQEFKQLEVEFAHGDGLLRKRPVMISPDIEPISCSSSTVTKNSQNRVGVSLSEISSLSPTSKPCEKENFVAIRKGKTQPRKVSPPPRPKELALSKLADVQQAGAGAPDLSRMIPSRGEYPAFKLQKQVPDETFYDASVSQPLQKCGPPIGLVERVAKQEARAWIGAKNATREMLVTKLRVSLDAIEKQKKTEERGNTALKIAKPEQEFKQFEDEFAHGDDLLIKRPVVISPDIASISCSSSTVTKNSQNRVRVSLSEISSLSYSSKEEYSSDTDYYNLPSNGTGDLHMTPQLTSTPDSKLSKCKSHSKSVIFKYFIKKLLERRPESIDPFSSPSDSSCTSYVLMNSSAAISGSSHSTSSSQCNSAARSDVHGRSRSYDQVDNLMPSFIQTSLEASHLLQQSTTTSDSSISSTNAIVNIKFTSTHNHSSSISTSNTDQSLIRALTAVSKRQSKVVSSSSINESNSSQYYSADEQNASSTSIGVECQDQMIADSSLHPPPNSQSTGSSDAESKEAHRAGTVPHAASRPSSDCPDLEISLENNPFQQLASEWVNISIERPHWLTSEG